MSSVSEKVVTVGSQVREAATLETLSYQLKK